MIYLIFAYTVVIYMVGVIIGRISKRLDYEKEESK